MDCLRHERGEGPCDPHRPLYGDREESLGRADHRQGSDETERWTDGGAILV